MYVVMWRFASLDHMHSTESSFNSLLRHIIHTGQARYRLRQRRQQRRASLPPTPARGPDRPYTRPPTGQGCVGGGARRSTVPSLVIIVFSFVLSRPRPTRRRQVDAPLPPCAAAASRPAGGLCCTTTNAAARVPLNAGALGRVGIRIGRGRKRGGGRRGSRERTPAAVGRR